MLVPIAGQFLKSRPAPRIFTRPAALLGLGVSRILAMKIFSLLLALLALWGCSAADRQYLLTYEHPKTTNSTAVASASSPILAPTVSTPRDAVPAPSPTQPVTVTPEPTVEAPLASETLPRS